MSFMTGTLLDPFQIPYLKRKLTMEEMVNKFINEGRREHDEMEAFIKEFRTTNELLLKERNNSLCELGFEVYGLTRAFEKAHSVNYEIKGVTTRGGKTTIEATQKTNITIKPPTPHHDEPITPLEAPPESEPKKTLEKDTRPKISQIPFPQRLKKEKEEAQQRKFLENLKQLQLNIPFTEALAQMPKYAKFLKSLLSNKTRLEEACTVTMNERCSAVLLNKLPLKEKDPGSFTIPCDIGNLHIDNALADLGASISMMPYSMYEKLGLGEPKLTRISLELADRSIQYPREIAENVLIKVDKFFLPVDFVILDMREDTRILIILRRLFLATAGAMIYVFNKRITLGVGDEEELMENDHTDSFLLNDLDIGQANLEGRGERSDFEKSIRRIKILDTAYSVSQETQNFEKTWNEHLCSASANEIDEKKPELKDLPSHLEYAYLNGDRACPVIVSSKLTKKEKTSLLQVLEKHKGVIAWKINEFYCFLDGFSGFFQILIAPEDQEKTTFTCPYGTFAYRRMPFGLCNTPATFQRCMTAIFHDMVEDFMEVFMDDFSVFGNSFNHCLGIFLGHKISGKGIEVDRAKIDVIAKLPYLTNVKEVRSFLGHAGFYRRFIKDFSMISKPMTQLLMKDANDFAVGAVLRQRIDGKFKPIYYASKTLNDAQAYYTTEKDLLAVVFSFDRFLPYLILSKTIVYTDHSALKYLFSKQDAKPRLIRWVMLLQGFNIEIKDKKGAENLAADHLFRLENPNMEILTEIEIVNEFPDEHLMVLKTTPDNDEPWYADYVNYIVGKVIPPKWTSKKRTAQKTPKGCTPFRLVYGKASHLPVEVEHKAYWALKQCNMDLTATAKNHFMALNELMELQNEAYENTRIYKEKAKSGTTRDYEGIKTSQLGTKFYYLTLASDYTQGNSNQNGPDHSL
ncbi:reverse transcriptase domain-containing protein [Tanacetum coccineum]